MAWTPTVVVSEADKGPRSKGGCIRLNMAKAFSLLLLAGNAGVFVKNALRVGEGASLHVIACIFWHPYKMSFSLPPPPPSFAEVRNNLFSYKHSRIDKIIHLVECICVY